MVDVIKKLDHRGVTLIEVITSMSLLFIILPVVLVFFFSGIRSCDGSHDLIEIQNQGQSIINFMSDRVMTSSKIIMIKDYKGLSFYGSDEKVELGELKLKDDLLEDFLLTEESLSEEMHIFSIQKDPEMEGKSIRYGNNKVAKTEAGNYIKFIYVEPLPHGNTYEDAKGIKFTMIMEKGNREIKIFRNIYFRN